MIKDKRITIRINSSQVNRLAKFLGIMDTKGYETSVINASLNYLDNQRNVINTYFGINMGHLFNSNLNDSSEDIRQRLIKIEKIVSAQSKKSKTSDELDDEIIE